MDFRPVRPAGSGPKLRLSDKKLILILPARVMAESGLDPKSKVAVLYGQENRKAAIKLQPAKNGDAHWAIKSFKDKVYQVVVPELAAKVTANSPDRELKYQKVSDGIVFDLPEALTLIDDSAVPAS